MKRSNLRSVVIGLGVLAFIAFCSAGCRKGTDPVTRPPAASSPKQQTQLEKDLDFVRTGQFIYVFIFTRKDGGIFTSDDNTYLKANSPQETNQWIISDGGRRVIAGTNFEFKQEHFDALNKRFNIENVSGK